MKDQKDFDRFIAIGDIHGYAEPFLTLLDEIKPTTRDRIVTLGDYVDRGPHNKEVIDILIALYARGILLPLRGNHDMMMLDAAMSPDIGPAIRWFRASGLSTMANYGYPTKTYPFEHPGEYIFRQHLNFLKDSCRNWLQTEDFIYVHGGVNHHKPMHEQDADTLLWQRFEIAQPHYTGRKVICGHSSVPEIANHVHTVCIDTQMGTRATGCLTALDTNSGQYWSVNRNSETTRGKIQL